MADLMKAGGDEANKGCPQGLLKWGMTNRQFADFKEISKSLKNC
jgi:hypothetical protein